MNFPDNVQRPKQTTKRGPRVYGTSRWLRLRKIILARDPICVACGGKFATDVDHIDGNPTNMRETNLQGLCHSCHSKKTNYEQHH